MKELVTQVTRNLKELLKAIHNTVYLWLKNILG